MTQVEIELARHGERINNHEKRIKELGEVVERIDQKLDRFQNWLLTVAGGVVASLILLVVNLII